MLSRFIYIRARLSISYTDFEDEMSYSEFIHICIQWYNTLLFVYTVSIQVLLLVIFILFCR